MHRQTRWRAEAPYQRAQTQGTHCRVFTSEAFVAHPALSALLRLIADEVEMSKPPSPDLLDFHFRSLLIYVARIDALEPLSRCERPLRDARVEKALALLNADIAKRWTVELLARAVGLSRAVFARRFQCVLRLSPLRYLTQKRMQVAAALLLDPDAAIAQVAGRVGYDSEFAFNRAFKKHHGVPPGVYRRGPRQRGNVVCLSSARAA